MEGDLSPRIQLSLDLGELEKRDPVMAKRMQENMYTILRESDNLIRDLRKQIERLEMGHE